MYDPEDVIAYLFPHEGKGFDGAELAITMARNQARSLPARNSVAKKPRDIPSRQERGGTEPPVEGANLENIDHLTLRFSRGARTRVGLVVGHAATADLTVQKIPGISTFHLAFTFDDQYRLIVRDLGSKGGTKVTYNKEDGERKSDFSWLLGGPSILKGKPPILNMTDQVQFKVVVPHRDNKSPDYIDRVKQFRVGTKDPDDLFASFILLNAPGTRLPTGQHTPSAGSHANPIFIKKKVGSGSFGIVEYVWNVTTGDEYVVKRPLPKHIETNSVSIKSWKQEAAIMKKISHPHIVMFRGATFSPWPELKFEYVPGGSLDTYCDLSTFENTQITCQLSSALENLHNRPVSIAHRDIKPENILVVERGENGIYVKFADFGFSKQGDTLRSCLGTPIYAAPELYLKAADRIGTANDVYGVAVDIWSLGAVIASLECGLPEYDDEWGNDPVGWIRAVRKHVEEHFRIERGELIWLLLDKMLVEDPDERSSADCCHDEAQKLLQRFTATPLYQESDDDDDCSTTPEASRLVAQSAVEPKSAGSEASTVSLGTGSAYSDSSQTPTREATVRNTVESINGSLIAKLGYRGDSLFDSPTDSTDFEKWQQSGDAEPEDQPDQVLARHQTTHKRTWPVDKSRSSRPASSFTGPSADNCNRDSREPFGSPSHKRRRRGGG